VKKKTVHRALAACLTALLLFSLLPGFASAQKGIVSEAATDAPLQERDCITLDSFGGAEGGMTELSGTTEDPDSFLTLTEDTPLGGNGDGRSLDTAQTAVSGGDDSLLGLSSQSGEPTGTGQFFTVMALSLFFSQGFDASNSGELTNPSAAQNTGDAALTVSQDSLLLQLSGGEKQVSVTAVDPPETYTLRAIAFDADGKPASLVGTSFSGTILTVTPRQAGTCYIRVYLVDAQGIILTSRRISVCVFDCIINQTGDLTLYDDEKQGLLFTADGYAGVSEFTVSTDNANAYSVTLARRSGHAVRVYITGKRAGSGQVVVCHRAKLTGEILNTAAFSVTVKERQRDSFALSETVLCLAKNETAALNASYSGYDSATVIGCSYSDEAVCSARVVKNGNKSCCITIEGKQNGTCTVYVLLKSADKLLCSACVAVRVGGLPTVTPQTTAPAVEARGCVPVNLSLQNIAPGLELEAVNENAALCSAALTEENGSYALNIMGKNGGSSEISLILRSGSRICSQTTVQVTVSGTAAQAEVSAQSIRIAPGETDSLRCSYWNVPAHTPTAFCVLQKSGCVRAHWSNSWSGNNLPLSLTGVQSGTDTLTLQMLNASTGAVLVETEISVTVAQSKDDFDICQLSYSFPNYGKNNISRSLCRMLYGDNQVAEKIFDYNIGSGGCCFGMAASAQLLYTGAVTTADFGKSTVYELAKSDENPDLGISDEDLIGCMHISQIDAMMYSTYGMDNVAQLIMEQTAADQPVLVCMFYNQMGHAITAYDYTLTDTTLTASIYDSNFPGREKQLVMTRADASSPFRDWCFDLYGGNYWTGDTNTGICACTSETLANIWNSKGLLTANWTNVTGGNPWNLVMTTESDFTLSVTDPSTGEEKTVVRYENGYLVEGENNVYGSFLTVSGDDEAAENMYMMLLPLNEYIVRDDSAWDGMEITIMDENLSAQVETDADTFRICADFSRQTAFADIAAGAGERYYVCVDSSIPTLSRRVAFSGTGNSNRLQMGISQGVTVGDQGNLPADHQLYESSVSDAAYSVIADCSAGGTITGCGIREYAAGADAAYRIVPNGGYRIAAVYVDGLNAGACGSFGFEGLDRDHTIHAEFVRALDSCTLCVEVVTGSRAFVSVRDEKGDLLTAYEDYLAAEAGAALYVFALQGSGYAGAVRLERVSSPALLVGAQLVDTDVQITLGGQHSYPVQLAAAVYTADGRYLGMKTVTVPAQQTAVLISLSDMTLPEGFRVRVLIYDRNCIPVNGAADAVLSQ